MIWVAIGMYVLGVYTGLALAGLMIAARNADGERTTE